VNYNPKLNPNYMASADMTEFERDTIQPNLITNSES